MSQEDQPLRFQVLSSPRRLPSKGENIVYLLEDGWDDWFEFETLYSLFAFNRAGEQIRIGEVKIGQFEMSEKQRRPALPIQGEESLGEAFFSVGQDASYYEALNTLGPELRSKILHLMRDVAADLAIWEKCKLERVTQVSLLRSVLPTAIEGQFHRMALGGARLTRYQFSYSPPKEKGEVPFTISFEVIPESSPPTNVHVLIGRNGVGKTRLMSSITKALLMPAGAPKRWGVFQWAEDDSFGQDRFAGLVTVSFSAFDDEGLLPDLEASDSSIPFNYIGLRRRAEAGKAVGRPKSSEMLTTEFLTSLRECQVEARVPRWIRAMEMVAVDPIFRGHDLNELIKLNLDDDDDFKRASKTFGRLSSGHKIVVLTLTRLVECVQEKTLVLIDEPEAHLHPPLLSALIRALSSLLIDLNGVAIVATHSPVILQEVPKQCVWMLSRHGAAAKAERPSIETFGENVGTLSHEVFKLELVRSGFYNLLRDVAGKKANFKRAVSEFEGQLGDEARAILRALYLEQDGGREE